MTNPIPKIAELIEQHLGVRTSRTENVARALQEAGQLPRGGPFTPPDFDRDDTVRLLVAVATGAKLADVAAATTATLAAVPGGADITSAPLSVPRNSEIQLGVLAGMAIDGDTLDGLTIEVVHGWPEVAVKWKDGVTQRLQAVGTIPNHQPGHQGRIATTIPGPAFAHIIKEACSGQSN
ncbi:hypothetical protein [Oryzifoliimicrobium ureilyticus]|uniref:hypothetical protein n=1 Tax=Oryzifoliimicrobium ureilyticus TaxID=3113724 RepID=UPI003075FC86